MSADLFLKGSSMSEIRKPKLTGRPQGVLIDDIVAIQFRAALNLGIVAQYREMVPEVDGTPAHVTRIIYSSTTEHIARQRSSSSHLD